jgi:hypothetical protein
VDSMPAGPKRPRTAEVVDEDVAVDEQVSHG